VRVNRKLVDAIAELLIIGGELIRISGGGGQVLNRLTIVAAAQRCAAFTSCAIGVAIRRPVIALLFQRGSFTADSTRLAGWYGSDASHQLDHIELNDGTHIDAATVRGLLPGEESTTDGLAQRVTDGKLADLKAFSHAHPEPVEFSDNFGPSAVWSGHRRGRQGRSASAG